MSEAPNSPAAFTVAWITALSLERAAAIAMLDTSYNQPPANFKKNNTDPNSYSWGKFGEHYVVIASLPAGRYGTNSAATVAQGLISSLPHVRIGLLVGIGGGIPGEISGSDHAPKVERNIRLGDVVVSQPDGTIGGVVQADLVKLKTTDNIVEVQRKGFLNSPPTSILTALSKLQSVHELEETRIPELVQAAFEKYPKMKRAFEDPTLRGVPDVLRDRNGDEIIREARDDPAIPHIHYGTIASGNMLIKSTIARDEILARLRSEQIEPMCFEMEAAGLMNDFPCLIIRGISDYANEDKNDEWQRYAAINAAAYAKEFLGCVETTEVKQEPPLAAIFKTIQDDLQCINTGMTTLRDDVSSKQMQALLDWICPISYSQEQNEAFRRWQPGTGQWFLNHPDIQKWRQRSKRTILGLGGPGTGKTTLSALLVDQLRRDTAQQMPVLWLYCNYNRRETQSVDHFLLSLLRQLADPRYHLTHHIEKWVGDHRRRNDKPHPSEVEQKLLDVVEQAKYVYIVVDALDECDLVNRRDLLNVLKRLSERGNVGICATSRLDVDTQGHFANHEQIEIKASAADISVSIESSIPSLSSAIRNDEELQKRIRKAVVEAADGMFLLARLYVESLRNAVHIQEVEDRIAGFSARSDGFDAYKTVYNATIERIKAQSPNRAALAIKIFAWISCAKRPLTVPELQHALATDTDTQGLNEKRIPDIETMTSVCGGLVEPVRQLACDATFHNNDLESVYEHVARGDVMVLQFVHYTVQEYFKQTQHEWFPRAHSDLAHICITYLSFDTFVAPKPEWKCRWKFNDEIEERRKHHHLLEYAVCNWGWHMRAEEKRADGYSSRAVQAAFTFLRHRKKVRSAAQSLDIFYMQTRGVRGIHLAAFAGLATLTKLLIINGEYPDVQTDVQQITPLELAAKHGHIGVIDVLLHDGKIKADAKVGYLCRTALIHAAVAGQITVVEALLANSEVDPNACDVRGETALMIAATNEDHTVVAMLLSSSKVDPNKRDAMGRSVLYRVASWGSGAMVERLLSTGRVNANLRDIDGGTPLHCAARGRYGSVVVMLLRIGRADPNLVDKNGRTALHWAAMEGAHGVGETLLRIGRANPDLRDREGKTALDYEVERGHSGVVTPIPALRNP